MTRTAIRTGLRTLPAGLPLLLGFLQAVGPVSTDMYLPAFPAIDASFGAGPGSAQFTLATWIVGLAVGQLGQGILTDRIGRRAPLIAGTALYTLASAGCALSGTIGQLATFRFFGAVGAAASMIVPRAVVRDLASGQRAARLMSRLILILGAAPILAPSLGGALLQVASWRAIFWVMTAYGATGCVLATIFLPDTLSPAKRLRLPPGELLRRFGQVLTERGFITHAAMLASVAFALFAYLGGSPTAFIRQYRLSPGVYAIAFGLVALVYVASSQLNVPLTRRWGIDRALRRVSLIYVLGAGATFVLGFSAWGGAVAFAGALALTLGVTGFINPNATVGALARHSRQAGIASALLGTAQFAIGASAGFLVAAFDEGTAKPMVTLILAGAVAAKFFDVLRPHPPREQDGKPL